MRVGIVGLGRMGAALSRQALASGHDVVGYSIDVSEARALEPDGLVPATSLDDLVGQLRPPRVVLLYVPHGPPVHRTVEGLAGLLDPGDIVADGGNSLWTDAEDHHRRLADLGVHFLDIGTSGGISGARHGACFMVGGDAAVFEVVRPLLVDLAVDDRAVIHAGPSGSGHFVKLVHNAIEFGMLQAIAEGVELLVRSGRDLDLPALFDNWNHGSVIRSWLVELMGQALADDPGALHELSSFVEDTGEVKWVVEWASRQDIPAPVVALSQQMLMLYRDGHRAPTTPMAKAVALMRHGFGGHPLQPRGP
ncbi:MAG TPA: decarboxylating 6-phosphogluconate dehydrogenase [Nitriliruptorales bacterium]|nr:decarboxylating 6-phosphogluconate dehydrogenase [Nitriliruptorales bacterium]